jgi:hypothetical protein
MDQLLSPPHACSTSMYVRPTRKDSSRNLPQDEKIILSILVPACGCDYNCLLGAAQSNPSFGIIATLSASSLSPFIFCFIF